MYNKMLPLTKLPQAQTSVNQNIYLRGKLQGSLHVQQNSKQWDWRKHFSML